MKVSRRSILLAAPGLAALQAFAADRTSPPSRIGNRDLPLPEWGPYSDQWNGVSHICDELRGLRMDFACAPAILRRETLVPYAEMGLDMQPVRADPRLGYVRWECGLKAGIAMHLEWCALGADGGMLRLAATNRSDAPLPLLVNWLARLSPPTAPARTRWQDRSGIAAVAKKGEAARPAEVRLPPGAVWVGALDYRDLEWAKPRFDDHLVFDGRRRGEVFEAGFVGNTGIGQGFGADAGDRAEWAFMAGAMRDAVIRIRYRIAKGTSAFRVSGPADAIVTLGGGGDPQGFRTVDVAVGAVKAGTQNLRLTALGGQAVEIDGFAVGEAAQIDTVIFADHGWKLQPERQMRTQNALTLRFPEETGSAYAMAWTGGKGAVHGVAADDVRTLGWALNDPSLFTMSRVAASGSGYVTIATPEVVTLKPGETVVRDCFVGTAADTVEVWRAAGGDAALERARRAAEEALPEGAQRLMATLSTNVVFPVWTGGKWVRLVTPGREWNSVYTWDCGFIGLGLAGRDPGLSAAVLDAYLTRSDDDQAAFLHHGTPLPIQFYLFHELWNRNGSLDFARARYPGLKRYARFLLGDEGSTCRDLKSGLIRTYDYFYNTGGMDDYPAQMAVHAKGMAACVAPVITTAHVIRCLRILVQVAGAIGERRDIAVWEAEIARLGGALQSQSWDEGSGYFAYVVHDEDKRPVGKWLSDKGENFNMGLDGVSPLLSDICTTAQARTLIDNLMTPGRLMTPSGITAVDARASYYDRNGYWNGSVWMPHQWLMWKALLDYDEGAKAWQVAETALRVYEAEIARSGRAYENFDAVTGAGGGWHPFGALSSPVRCWAEAYGQAGTLSTGFNTRVVRQVWDSGLTADLEISGARAVTVLAVLKREPVTATWNGQAIEMVRRGQGVDVIVPPGRGRLLLR
ncbi:MGH1-like glycoside hydrolase domain-containing protein [Asticcacaulis solisilvae]|uniref:MGH1-like glycoside hydrolase domain-containing protein n=1 Tax=Asticcacaulis solisilvae TaxID=1217274 RepID=UPI003FD78921